MVVLRKRPAVVPFRGLLLALCLIGSLPAWPTIVRSQERTTEDAGGEDRTQTGLLKEEARALVDEANDAFNAEEYVEAGRLFLEAHDLIEENGLGPKPELLYNAGLAFERIDACDVAADLFERFIAAKPEPSALESARLRLAKASACAPEVTIDTTPPGADVRVDEEPRGTSPIKIRLREGTHRVALELEGHETFRGSFVVRPGHALSFLQALHPIRTTGRIAVDLREGTTLFIDDASVLRGPYRADEEVSSGAHRIRIERAGCASPSIEIDVPEDARVVVPDALDLGCAPAGLGAPVAPSVRAASGVDALNAWGLGGAALGLAGLAVGATLAILSNKAADRRDAELAKGPEVARADLVRDEQDRAFDLAVGAHVSFGVAAAGVIGAGVLFVLDRDEE